MVFSTAQGVLSRKNPCDGGVLALISKGPEKLSSYESGHLWHVRRSRVAAAGFEKEIDRDFEPTCFAPKRLVIPLSPNGPKISAIITLPTSLLQLSPYSQTTDHMSRTEFCRRPPVHPGSHMRINDFCRRTSRKYMIQVLHRYQAHRALIRAASHSPFHKITPGR
ncbi:Photosystem antenna protein-like protein [Cynara cardunculus var. scolymus]|uniref:Photosystem antenna protein-like protein n=1 Tax=Cynara cardunculus var. scolymus TaxID=59895 RepID=A0A103XEN4_CYNCS|nr:Photosystem antenna protein-like protein [Cynara cardunculus var. scolymus]